MLVFAGKLRISKKVGDFPNLPVQKAGDFQESWGFPRNCAGVRYWVILVAPRRVQKINQSIEVGTSELRVSTFGLSS